MSPNLAERSGAFYTYDAEADALYIELMEEDTVIERTEELASNVHVDIDPGGSVVGVEFLYPRANGIDLEPVKQRYGIELSIPFTFTVEAARR